MKTLLSVRLLIILTLSLFQCVNAGCSTEAFVEKQEQNDAVNSLQAESPNQIQELDICSFNIQFLGMSRSRHDEALADIVKDYDIVVVQELVSPPYEGQFPSGDQFKPDQESADFFDEMKSHGFSYRLSEEDTGTGEKIHINSSATEWWVVFYKPDKIKVANDLPSGFLASDRSNHDDYERVPYAFPFRTINDKMDFVLISVHLQPGKSSTKKQRRKHELSSIEAWIKANNESEKDFVILGDMNIYSPEELSDVTPAGFLSLNDECRPTNTNVNGPLPYDHVMYDTTFTKIEIDKEFDLEVVNLIAKMEPYWSDISDDPYPGMNPYNHNEFRKHFSDHNPVVFRMIIPAEDDD